MYTKNYRIVVLSLLSILYFGWHMQDLTSINLSMRF